MCLTIELLSWVCGGLNVLAIVREECLTVGFELES